MSEKEMAVDEKKSYEQACDLMQGVYNQLISMGLDNQTSVITTLSSALMVSFAYAPSEREALRVVNGLLPWAATVSKDHKPKPKPTYHCYQCGSAEVQFSQPAWHCVQTGEYVESDFVSFARLPEAARQLGALALLDHVCRLQGDMRYICCNCDCKDAPVDEDGFGPFEAGDAKARASRRAKRAQEVTA